MLKDQLELCAFTLKPGILMLSHEKEQVIKSLVFFQWYNLIWTKFKLLDFVIDIPKFIVYELIYHIIKYI